MLAMFFLGIAAGMLNVYRAVTGTSGAVGYRPHTPENIDAVPPSKQRNWDDEDC
jgi:hypothetical protein